MTEEPKDPRIEGDELIIETQDSTEIYDARYLVAAVLVFVAKGDGKISGEETTLMLELISAYFQLPSAESLSLLTNAMEDIAENPDFENLMNELSKLLSREDKEEVALMMLKVVAANGRKNAEEMAKLRKAAEIIEIPPDILHRAYDRHFEETQV